MVPRPLLLLCISCAPPVAGCVAYTPDPADVATVAAEVRQRGGGRFDFTAAFALACAQNPDLRALAADARAAGLVVEPAELQSEYRSDTEMLAVMLDPLAILDLGARGAADDVADAEAAAAAQALAAGRWRIAGELAEVFESERALAALTVPAFAVDPDVYERAGLAAPVAAQRLRAASARAAAEHQELATAHASNLATCRRLLGLPAPAAIELVPPAADWLPDPAFDEQVLLARPDLALTAARFQVADAAFRQAVWEQYPSLMIGPEFPLNGDPLQWMGVLRLPVFAAGRAAAAQARRDAARAELEAAWTAASSEASIAAAELTALAAAAAGTGAALAASAADLQSALVLVQVEDDAFDRLVDAATMAVRETMEHRQAVLALARARVRRAVVCGWPAAAAGAAPGLAGIAKAKEGS